MRTIRQSGGAEEIQVLDDADTRVLGAGEERELLRDLAACKQKLVKALEQIDGVDLPRGADDPLALAHFIASNRANEKEKGEKRKERLGEVKKENKPQT